MLICGKLRLAAPCVSAQIATQQKGRQPITASVKAAFTLVVADHTSHLKVVSQELLHLVQGRFCGWCLLRRDLYQSRLALSSLWSSCLHLQPVGITGLHTSVSLDHTRDPIQGSWACSVSPPPTELVLSSTKVNLTVLYLCV